MLIIFNTLRTNLDRFANKARSQRSLWKNLSLFWLICFLTENSLLKKKEISRKPQIILFRTHKN